jgi:ketosteroid isomerase-like protein
MTGDLTDVDPSTVAITSGYVIRTDREHMMSTDTDQINKFLEEWMQAELAGDSAAIGERLSGDFLGVGPLGFMLPREAWLQRFDHGLHYDEFDLAEAQVRQYGDTAVVVGRQTQSGSFGGNPLPFSVVRTTLLLERTSGSWRLAGAHMSFIAGTPGAPPVPGR